MADEKKDVMKKDIAGNNQGGDAGQSPAAAALTDDQLQQASGGLCRKEVMEPIGGLNPGAWDAAT